MNTETLYNIYNFIIIKGTECPLGYIGRYCDTQCTFPYYGVDCQQTCACSPSKCNFTSGCPNLNHSKWKSVHICNIHNI